MTQASYQQLYWQCRRGMRELDILMNLYLNNHYQQATKNEQQLFQQLLQLPDEQLYHYLIGNQDPTDTALAALVAKIKLVLKYV
jgi:antitoxin CptB